MDKQKGPQYHEIEIKTNSITKWNGTRCELVHN